MSLMNAWFMLLAAGSSAEAGDRHWPEAKPVTIAQVLVQERVIMRVPVRPLRLPPKPVKWKEVKADKCIAARSVAGAAVLQNGSVDFILKGGKRVRARFERACPALDFYSGFYLKPTADGKICARRDSIHARSGGACEIRRFRLLIPKVTEKDQN